MFPLRKWIMKPFYRRDKPYEVRIFNYRLSLGQNCAVENAFPSLANRWKCLLTTMHQKPKVVQRKFSAALCLHILMRERYPALQNGELDVEVQTEKLSRSLEAGRDA
uniref:DDE Tnp4 domain-containing protein n=1 Tax=Branchiostoma floridae TaxID=7739 RepID=C3YB69_BRAFL|eukprot:XP_002606521.1 hypothetical protein BRAFLDRAFT_91895 [Branchiostoma floridae]